MKHSSGSGCAGVVSEGGYAIDVNSAGNCPAMKWMTLARPLKMSHRDDTGGIAPPRQPRFIVALEKGQHNKFILDFLKCALAFMYVCPHDTMIVTFLRHHIPLSLVYTYPGIQLLMV